MSFEVRGGVYPTMITPYKNGEVDYDAVEKLTEWYWKKGCHGIFAACQSSEIMFLSLEDRVKLVRTVMKKTRELAAQDPSRPPMMIVASGHISDDFDAQVEELNLIAAEKPDALILISNRMDIANTTEDKWIEDTEKLIAKLPADMPLGVYECPKPYKRLLTDKMVKWCADSGRFYFVKDTCCDAEVIARRIKICEGSNLKILNANAQTMLSTLQNGGYGYCGVMANFHPELYCALWESDYNSREASLLQDFLGLAATIESLTYPCCAKYYLDKYEGIAMERFARSNDEKLLTKYQTDCVDQLAELADEMKKQYC